MKILNNKTSWLCVTFWDIKIKFLLYCLKLWKSVFRTFFTLSFERRICFSATVQIARFLTNIFFVCSIFCVKPILSNTLVCLWSEIINDADAKARKSKMKFPMRKQKNHGIYIKNTCRQPLYKNHENDSVHFVVFIAYALTQHKWNSVTY